MTPKKTALLSLALGLAACTVGPDYQAPKQTLAVSFAEGSAQPIGQATQQYWWRAFNDATLNDLVQTGLNQNLDIQTAIARVAEAQAVARTTGLPSLVSGNLSAQRTVSGSDMVDNSAANSGSFNPAIVLDLFGGERRSREAALASLQSAELSVGSARLAYLSSLVTNYIDMRYFQNALAINRQTIETRRDTLSLVQSQREAGAATALDEAQAQASLDADLAALPTLEAGFYAATYAIATLLAQPVQTIEDRLERGAAQPRPASGADVGVPADLVRNRPDVRAAERKLAAATAEIGIAEAALYPSLTLGGTITRTEGFDSWTYGPSVLVPVLNQPALRASRDQQIAQAEQAELQWRSSVLDAVEEVQSAQSSYLRNRRAVAAYQRSVASNERVVELSRETYRGGTTTLLDLLTVQRSLSSARLTLASSVRDLATSWASLQVAAGKGWVVPTATRTVARDS